MGLAVVLSSVLVDAAPAHATGGATASSNGVVYECAQRTCRYSIDLPSGIEDRTTDSTVRGPDGLEARMPRTRTSITPSATKVRRGSVVRFSVSSKIERPKGYFPSECRRVFLPVFIGIKHSRSLTMAVRSAARLG